MTLEAGQILNNRYRVVKKLAAGGFGAVYRAWDLTLKKPCAVKENFEGSPQAQKQFEREALILAKLNHPNLPRVTDHFIIQGQYLVMDFVGGDDLQEMLHQQGRPFDEEQVLAWIDKICDALAYMHNQIPPIIHRDLKPANIKVGPGGEIMLVDFGIAKVYDPHMSTTVGARAITAGYSPPEQYGQGTTDARSDIYALGSTLYTLLTGQVPCESVRRTIGTRLEPPVHFNPNISLHVEKAILKAMELVPEDRFQTVESFKIALKNPTLVLPVVKYASVHQPYTVQAPASHPGLKWLPWAGLGILGIIGMVALVFFFLLKPLLLSPTPVVETVVIKGRAVQDNDLIGTPTPADTRSGVEPTSASDQSDSRDQSTQTPIPTETPTAPPADPLACVQIDQTWTSPVDGMTLVCVPSGEFLMGSAPSDPLSEDFERPQHSIYLDAYWVDQIEITNALFSQFVKATGHVTQAEMDGWSWEFNGHSFSKLSGTNWRHPRGPDSSLQGLDDHPVVRISWDDVYAYCSWAGRRLPTEAEWEKAARGTDGRLYPWGDASPSSRVLNFNSNLGTTAPVGSYPDGVSIYGAYDMAGNVWEWVMDWHQEYYYHNSPFENPIGPPNGDGRGMRGGSWFSSEIGVRAAYREWGYQDGSYWSTGFRCVLDASP
jgi:formylglycine-generating enzyme required for sulfatase activity